MRLFVSSGGKAGHGKGGFMEKLRLKRVSKIEPGELPFQKSTFYRWRHLRKFPGLFVKCSGGLFVDLDELDKVIEKGRQK